MEALAEGRDYFKQVWVAETRLRSEAELVTSERGSGSDDEGELAGATIGSAHIRLLHTA
jgi:hypothetical protein